MPEHVYAVAYEEAQLLCALRDQIPQTDGVRPSITIATCNELVQEAQLTLTEPARAKVMDYVERLSQQAVHDGLTQLPPPTFLRPRGEAEAIAQVARALPFETDPREVASGIYLAASRIFNILIHAILPQHQWTSLSVSLNNHTEPHYDAHNATNASLLIGLSHHDRGQLWKQDNAGDVVMESEGTRYWGIRYPTAGRAILFDSKRLLHGTLPWMGDRYILIAYTVGSRSTTKAEHIEYLQSAGYRLQDTWDAWRPTEGKGQTKLGRFFGSQSDAPGQTRPSSSNEEPPANVDAMLREQSLAYISEPAASTGEMVRLALPGSAVTRVQAAPLRSCFPLLWPLDLWVLLELIILATATAMITARLRELAKVSTECMQCALAAPVRCLDARGYISRHSIANAAAFAQLGVTRHGVITIIRLIFDVVSELAVGNNVVCLLSASWHLAREYQAWAM
ncbi:unnamed protein product [Symbiodinium sp. CCMP2592]|nr:unnamed protein product [Symbiodinium sp. CCMP2592]